MARSLRDVGIARRVRGDEVGEREVRESLCEISCVGRRRGDGVELHVVHGGERRGARVAVVHHLHWCRFHLRQLMAPPCGVAHQVDQHVRLQLVDQPRRLRVRKQTHVNELVGRLGDGPPELGAGVVLLARVACDAKGAQPRPCAERLVRASGNGV